MSSSGVNAPLTASSPTRIDLAGGTLDLWPLSSFVGGATTVNFAIDIMTEATFEWHQSTDIKVDVQGQSFQYDCLQTFLQTDEPMLKVLQQVVHHASKTEKFDRGFLVSSKSMSPVGAGLGGSSSLLITLLKLFAKVFPHLKLQPLQTIELAHNLEARVLMTPTGTQDYFPPVYGGLNIIQSSDLGRGVEVLPFPKELKNSFFLVYTGRPHHSGLNNFDVIQKVVAGDQKVFSALKKIKAISSDVAQAIKLSEWQLIPSLLNQESQARLELSPGFSSPEIEKLQTLARKDALASKICGAGGGGCVLIWAEPSKHETIQERCRNAGFQILKTQPMDPFKGS